MPRRSCEGLNSLSKEKFPSLFHSGRKANVFLSEKEMMIAQMRDPPLCSQREGNTASWASFHPIFQLYVPTVQNPQCLFLDPLPMEWWKRRESLYWGRVVRRSWRLKHQISTLSHSLELKTVTNARPAGRPCLWKPMFTQKHRMDSALCHTSAGTHLT